MPNRDQRRRDGTFEYAQLDLAPDEPARCEHGLMAAHFLPVDQKPVRGGCPGPAASGGPPMTRPDATLDQLRTLIDLANERHLHDAEQWLRERVEAAERMGVRLTCRHCGAITGVEGDHSCACSYSDETCPHHPAMRVAFATMRAAAVRCCDAGRTAYPDPCPWHAAEVER